MSDDQDGCEWVNVSSGSSLPMCVCVCARARLSVCLSHS